MIERFISRTLESYLATFRVVLLVGARQAGKSTLVKQMAQAKGLVYRTFDNALELQQASADPQGYIDNLPKPVVIDEVQRLPDVLLPIKMDVDSHTDKGRFFLTGSANILQLPKIADSLVGRMGVVQMFPLSQLEIESQLELESEKDKENNFIHRLFALDFPLSHYQPSSRSEIIARIQRGGYPEVVLASPEQRQLWFDSYVTTLIQRDIREVANIADITAMTQLLTLLATRPSSLLNSAALSRDLNLATTTLRRYLSLLETIHLVDILPSWQRNFGKRLIKAAKISLHDTGIICALLGIENGYFERNNTFLGHVLESFVLAELRKLASWSKYHSRVRFYHYRSQSRSEVDIIMELSNRSFVGLEVKLSQSINLKDFTALSELRDKLEHFHRGIIFYQGTEVRRFAEKLYAVPLQALWQN